MTNVLFLKHGHKFFFQQGNLAEALVLREYNKYFDIGSIDDHLSISVNVHDSGDVLEIVGMCCE